MDPSAIEIRVRDAEELRSAWLDGFEHGGIFVPGAFSLAAGLPVRVRIVTERPAATTVLDGTIVWRRLPQRENVVAAGMASLRPGIGIAFGASMSQRVLFLDRLARGAASEGRAAVRYPTEMRGEVFVRDSERPAPAMLVDVAVRGARILLSEPVIVGRESVVEVRIASPRSGESVRSGLVGRVAWSTREGKTQMGVRLELATTEERLHWAKVVTRAREVFEERPIKVPKLVG
jgi:Tfp pilus assembly protein PilZ